MDHRALRLGFSHFEQRARDAQLCWPAFIFNGGTCPCQSRTTGAVPQPVTFHSPSQPPRETKPKLPAGKRGVHGGAPLCLSVYCARAHWARLRSPVPAALGWAEESGEQDEKVFTAVRSPLSAPPFFGFKFENEGRKRRERE